MKYYNKNGHEISRSTFYKKLKQLQQQGKSPLYAEGTTGTNESYKQIIH
jgi:hypothetical protein